MDFSKEQIKIIQHLLNSHPHNNITVDGLVGPKTFAAVQKINQISSEWNDKRQLIGVIQYGCMQNDIDGGPIDGLWGPQTEHGFDQLQHKLQTGKKPAPWREHEGEHGNNIVGGEQWPMQTTDQLQKFYGNVGENQTKLNSPYTMRLAWDTSYLINQFSCHKKVKETFEAVLEETLEHYTEDGIQQLGLDMFGGCLNVRKMRGGDDWSTHSWGIALDMYPQQNKLKWGSDKAAFAKPEYDKWNQIWQEHGVVSLGCAKNYDYMHYQCARVKV